MKSDVWSGEFPEIEGGDNYSEGDGVRGGEREGDGGRRGTKCCLVTVTDNGLLTVCGFRVHGASCRVWGAVQGAGCRVQGAGCRVQGAGCRVQGGR